MYLSRRAALSLLVCAVTAALTLASSNELFNHRREVVSDTPGVASEELLSYKDSGDVTPRTATGGIINTLLVLLTIVSFIGNGIFLVYVFWLSK